MITSEIGETFAQREHFIAGIRALSRSAEYLALPQSDRDRIRNKLAALIRLVNPPEARRVTATTPRRMKGNK